MNSIRLWESVYTRFLEIECLSDGSRESLTRLLEQFATIVEMIPDDIDPAVDFEMYVLGKLCQSAGNTLDSYLEDRDAQALAGRSKS